jgi:acetate kinase
LIASGLLEKIGSPEARLRQKRRLDNGTFGTSEIVEPVADHAGGFALIGRVNARDEIIASESDLFGIGHRVVHGGELFQEPTLITGQVIAAIRRLIPLAPLHNPANLLGIEVLRESFPRVPQVAVFDTMFHQTLPPRAFHYALPYDLYEKYHVRRYGFHGTSHLFVAKEAARHLGRALEETNLITLHLGNGTSAAAIQNGRSIDTSMGLTPLEGLVMGTRCGDIDPALHFYLLRQTGMSPEELEGLLNSRSGLKGLCGSNDMREILAWGEQGNERARLAVDLFCYRIRKTIGAYVAVLGRVDALVFTGGIGENAAVIREKVLEGMEHLGMTVDPQRNRNALGSVSEIQPENVMTNGGAKNLSPILVIQTDEELEIARQTIRVIGRGEKSFAPTEKNRRRSIRLKGYDYSKAGAYFVTVITEDRGCLFGNEVDGEIALNSFGEAVRAEWFRSQDLRPYLILYDDEFVVMPNHVHGIIWIADNQSDDVGARRRRAPTLEQFGKPVSGSIPTIIRAFKSATSKRINELRSTPGESVWQRNYYDHVIRDEADLNRVREYIAANPARWAEDEENPTNIKKVSV